ncbi:hypothetical protein Tco_0731887 [Tanacetum coccineum]
MLRHVSLEERPIVVLGLRVGLLGANPIPHRLAQGVQFSTGLAIWHDHAVWHDRAVWHEPEQFSLKLNNISLCVQELYTVQSPRVGQALLQQLVTSSEYTNYLLSAEDKYKGRGYYKGQKAEQKLVEIIEDKRDKVQAEYHMLELQPKGPLSESVFKACSLQGKVRLADDKTLYIASVRDVVLKNSFGTSWTLKDVRYISGLKRRLISVRQLDEEGYHVGFRDQQWKVTKGSLVVARGNNVEACIKLRWFGKAEESFLHDVREDKEIAEVGASSYRRL